MWCNPFLKMGINLTNKQINLKKMKNIFSILTIVIFTFISCSKDDYKEGKIIKNCTGSYLNIDDKEYLICNSEVVVDFNNDTEVLVDFTLIDNCNNNQGTICMMVYNYNGTISVNEITKK